MADEAPGSVSKPGPVPGPGWVPDPESVPEPVEGSSADIDASTSSATGTAVEGRVVVLGGGTSAAGRAIARALLASGARVVVVGSHRDKLDGVRTALRQAQGPDAGELHTELCDLTSEPDVLALGQRVRDRFGRVDGLIHLVGGWRGGGGLAGQSDEDYRALETGLTALRHSSRAFDADLRGSDSGRLAIVSSTVVERPLAGGANYATVKAASEAWTRAVAQGFAKAARDADSEQSAAAVIFRVKTLAGLEEKIAASVVDLWARQAIDLNETVLTLNVNGSPSDGAASTVRI